MRRRSVKARERRRMKRKEEEQGREGGREGGRAGRTLSGRGDDEAFGSVEERHGDVRQGHLLVVAKTEGREGGREVGREGGRGVVEREDERMEKKLGEMNE